MAKPRGPPTAGDPFSGFTVQDSQLSAKWEAVLSDRKRLQPLVQDAAEAYPDPKSVFVSFQDLQVYDPDLADYLLTKPGHCLRVGAQMLHQVDVTVEPRPRLYLRVQHLPKAAEITVRGLRAAHLGKFVAIEGLVKKVTGVRPSVLEAAFDCRTCGNRIRVVQEEELLQEPVLCDACEKAGPWKLREEDSRFIDHQKIELQDNPDAVRGAAQPESIVVYLQDDLVQTCSPGDRIRLNGILVAQKRKQQKEVKIEFEKVLQAVSLEHLEHGFEDIELSPEDEEWAKATSQRPDCWDLLVRSFARKVRGHRQLKESLLLAAFGSQGRMCDGVWQRGDIHVLLAGDPGTAKSELLNYVAALLPHVIQANGKSSSGVGLTAAAVRDDFGEHPWSLEAGVLVMANDGMAVVDELDKMSEADAAYMLDALAHQVIHLAKAGIVADMRTRCSFIGACNPEGGRFVDDETPASQIGLLLALLSRFDLPWAIRDRSSSDANRDIARHVLRAQGGIVVDDGEERLDADQLRKYIAYAKKEAKELTIDSEAEDFLVTYYDEVRQRNMAGENPGHVTPRVPASLYRLATARARAHCRVTANLQDAQAVVALLEASFRSMGIIGADGKWDSAVLTTGISLDQHTRMRLVMKVIRELAAANEKGYALEEDVLHDCKTLHQIPHDETQKALATLLRNNAVYARGGGGTYAPMNASFGGGA